jgi:hypothetical protein
MKISTLFLLALPFTLGCSEYDLGQGGSNNDPAGNDDDDTGDDDDTSVTGDDDTSITGDDDDDNGDDDTEGPPELEDVVQGWYVYDDGIAYETTSNPQFVVDHHGDEDLYWYEPSGGHGLLEPTQGHQQAFDLIEQHIIDHTNLDPSYLQEEFTYEGNSNLATYEFATFTYAMAYLTFPPGYNGQWTIAVESVDDGIEVLVNAHIIGTMKLNEANRVFDLDADIDGNTSVLMPGLENVIIIILVDDSQVDKYIRNLVFAYDGVPVEMGN